MTPADLYHSKEWRRVRLLALARDGHRCRDCGAVKRLHVDHIVPVEQGGAPLDLVNLQTLCKLCHDIKTAVGRRNGARGHNQPCKHSAACYRAVRSGNPEFHDPPRCGCSSWCRHDRPW